MRVMVPQPGGAWEDFAGLSLLELFAIDSGVSNTITAPRTRGFVATAYAPGDAADPSLGRGFHASQKIYMASNRGL